MDSFFVVQDCNQLNGSNVAANIHMLSTPMLPLVSNIFCKVVLTNIVYIPIKRLHACCNF